MIPKRITSARHAVFQLPFLFLALTLLTSCGSRDIYVTIPSAVVKEHALGGPNLCLLYEFDCVYETGRTEVRLVMTVDGGETGETIRIKGDGSMHGSFPLPGSFINDGDRAKVLALQSKIVVPTYWQKKMLAGWKGVVFAYTDLDGKKVQLEVRS